MDQDQVRLGGLLGLFKIFRKGKFKLIHVGDKASYQPMTQGKGSLTSKPT